MKKLLILLSCCFGVAILYGQKAVKDTLPQKVHSVHALYERNAKGVTLRWAPSTPKLWLQGIYNGYTIYKTEYDSTDVNTDIDYNKMQKLAVIKPKNKQEWYDEMKAMNPEDIPKMLAGAYQCTFGEYESLKNAKGLSGLQDQANELKNRYSFMMYIADLNREASKYAGLLYQDNSVENGKEYRYIISPNVKLKEGESMVISPGITVVNAGFTKYLPPEITVAQGEKRVQVMWARDTDLRRTYTAYYIERAEKGSAFTQLNELPYIHGVSRDSVFYHPMNIYSDSVANYKKYKYRIRGITPFGSLGPYSNEIEAMGVDKTPPVPPKFIETTYLGEQKMLIKWEKEEEPDMKGYHVFKTNNLKKDFYKVNEKMIPAGTHKYIDENVNPLLDNYYLILSIDKEGNFSKSDAEFAMIKDTIPPKTPTGLKGIIDTTGVLTLSWKRNRELDMRGYKVFFANDNKHEYTLLTGKAIRDTVYKHKITLNTLTEEAWFKVMAVDKRYNYSPLSEAVKVIRPDTIPPTSPIFKKYKVTQKSIYLSWANSGSKDVVRHELWRKKGAKGEWKKLKTFTQKEKEYTDTAIESKQNYIYKIIAVDDADLISPVANLLSLDAPMLLEKGVKSLKARLDKNKNVELRWTLHSDDCKVIIYRSIDNGALYPIKTLPSSENTYTDSIQKKNVTVGYTVRLQYNNGTSSPYSEMVVSKISE